MGLDGKGLRCNDGASEGMLVIIISAAAYAILLDSCVSRQIYFAALVQGVVVMLDVMF